VAFRSMHFYPHGVKKRMHALWNLLGSVLLSAGLAVVFKYKHENHIASLYSTHSWLGIFTSTLVFAQFEPLARVPYDDVRFVQAARLPDPRDPRGDGDRGGLRIGAVRDRPREHPLGLRLLGREQGLGPCRALLRHPKRLPPEQRHRRHLHGAPPPRSLRPHKPKELWRCLFTGQRRRQPCCFECRRRVSAGAKRWRAGWRVLPPPALSTRRRHGDGRRRRRLFWRWRW